MFCVCISLYILCYKALCRFEMKSISVMILVLLVQRGRSLDNFHRDYREIVRIIPDNVIKSIHRAFYHHPVNVSHFEAIIFIINICMSWKYASILNLLKIQDNLLKYFSNDCVEIRYNKKFLTK